MAELGDVGGPLSGTIAEAEVSYYPHIVDQLIAERGEKLFRSRALPIIKPFLYWMLRYKEAVRMADALAPLPGTAAMQYVSELLSLDLDVAGLEHIPRSGAFIVVANHPTGIADGVAVYNALRPVRPDISIFTNRDAIRINPRLSEFLIPVEWREAFRDRAKTKETLRISSAAFAGERAVVIFPSGRIAFWADKRLNERPWQASAVTLARKQGVPIVPAHVDARNSALFYWFANGGFTELRDMTVFHELLNKRGKRFGVRFGPIIPQDALTGDTAELTVKLQAHCAENLREDPQAKFVP